MPDSNIFSIEADGSLDFTLGSYARLRSEVRSDLPSPKRIRLEGIGDYPVPQEIIDDVDAQPGSAQLSPEQRARIIIGKLLSAGAKHVAG